MDILDLEIMILGWVFRGEKTSSQAEFHHVVNTQNDLWNQRKLWILFTNLPVIKSCNIWKSCKTYKVSVNLTSTF